MKRIVFLHAILISSMLSATQNTTLQKIFYHRTEPQNQKDLSHVMELATVVLYFSGNVQLKKTEIKNDGKAVVLEYMFPRTTIETAQTRGDVRDLLQKLQQVAQGAYHIAIQELESPDQIKMIIVYDPRMVTFEHELFDTIKLQKGIAFHFYNKNLIEHMKVKFNGGTILQTASLHKKPTIIIDPGHGGKDFGTISFSGIPEKNITLAIADKVRKTFSKNGFQTALTRDKDIFVELDERTLCANNCTQPCIFISLHGNNARNSSVSGVETYCLKKDLFTKDNACLQTCLDIVDQYKNSLYTQGQKLAQAVHANILKEVRKIDPHVPDRLVKHAVSQVLLGSQAPSILVEMDFLSNESKAKLLQREDYQQAIANGIMKGVLHYLS